MLAQHYDLVFSDDPDFTFFSCWGRRHLLDRGTKIFVSAENYPWDFSQCDFAITSDLVDDPRHFRLPVYARFVDDASQLVKNEPDVEAILREKTGFCNFVYSNAAPTMRDEFFEKLSRYKHVDSGGGHLNNLGHRVKDKLEFIRGYKFTIAFENGSHPGYTTEKLTDPMLADSLPLYWGNPRVDVDFNPGSFVHLQDGSLDDFVERVIEIDRDADVYARYVREPWFHDNAINQYLDLERLVEWLHPIFNRDPVLVSPSAADRFAFATWWVRRPGFDKAHRWVRNKPKVYEPARWIWNATGMRRLWRWINSHSGLMRPETPGSKSPTTHRSGSPVPRRRR
ncbi:MAG: alpha(1,3/1,4) fucosyltransferase [Actinomycetota bacterium]|nr:alpha(1,3/1,4) fucosyltransferase [Actinomycetota bacterium]